MGTLTDILTQFATTSYNGIALLTPYARNLVLILATIDTVCSHLTNLEDGDHIRIVIWNIMKYGFCYYLIGNYSTLIGTLLQGFIDAAFIATQSNMKVNAITDPSYILQLGAAIAAPLNQQLQVVSNLGGGFGQQMNLVAITMLVQLSYVFIAIQVFISYLQFYIMGALSVVLIPFLANSYTRFIADRILSCMVGLGLKMGVLALILSLTLPFIQNYVKTTAAAAAAAAAAVAGGAAADIPVMTLDGAMNILACSLTFAFLIWRVPNMAAKVMNGLRTSASK